MALPILDGNQSATTLSSILTSGEHIPAHTVVSLGTQAITDMRGAVSGSVVSISNFPATQTIEGTVTANLASSNLNSVTIGVRGSVTANSNLTATALLDLVEPVRAGVFQWADGELQAIISNSTPVISGTVTVGNSVTIGSLPLIAGTVTVGNSLTIQSGNISIEEIFGENSFVPISGTVTVGNSVTISSLPAISGTVTVSNAVELAQALLDQSSSYGSLDVNIGGVGSVTLPIAGTVTIGSALPAGTNRIGVVTIGNIQRSGDGVQSSLTTEIGSGYLNTRSYIGEGTAQIGSVTASISGTVPISISSVTVGNSVTIGSLPLIAGTVTANAVLISPSYEQINAGIESYIGDYGALPISGTVTVGNTVTIAGTVTANVGNAVVIQVVGAVQDGDGTTFGIDRDFPISGTVTAVNHQGTAVTTSNFTSTTPSTILASANSGREVLTIFNEGAGNLHICAGATCTTIAYQVRLSAGDYYEVPLNQTSLTHSAVFATAGTARVTQVS